MVRLKSYLNKVTLICIFAGIICLFFSCAAVPHKVDFYGYSHRIVDYYNNKVVVLPFTNLSGKSIATPILTDDFSLALIKLNLFDVIERYRLKDIFQEQDNFYTGNRIDMETAVKTGKILGAKAVFIGTIKRFDEYVSGFGLIDNPPIVEISVKMIDVQTGMNIWGAEDVFSGNDKGIQLLVSEGESSKVQTDVNYLSRLICSELVKTLISSTVSKKENPVATDQVSPPIDQQLESGTQESLSITMKEPDFKGVDSISNNNVRYKTKDNKLHIYLKTDDIIKYQTEDFVDSGIIILNDIIAVIKSNETKKIVIEIYTDNTPIVSAKYYNNTDYSIGIGNKIKSYFVEKEIPEDSIAVIGFGENHPILSNTTESSKSENRRINIIVFK